MTTPPPPTGHDVYWEKWMDAFELAEDVIDNLHADPEEEEGWRQSIPQGQGFPRMIEEVPHWFPF